MMIKLLAPALISLIAAQSPPAHVAVSDLIAHPADHYDQHLVVTGILKFSANGFKICELPSKGGAPGLESCIDIASSNSPLGRFDWSKRGALIAITGYFSHTCPPSTVPNEDGLYVLCLHRGGNGYINVQSLIVAGFVTCQGDDCTPEDTSGTHEIPALDAEAQGIDAFAKTLIAAARSRRADNIAAITFPTLRTETRFDLGTREALDRKYGEMANAPRSIIEPGRGFRLFAIDATNYARRHHQLCFCIKSDCASRWPEAPTDRRNSPFQCHTVWRGSGTWYLLY